MSLSRLFLRKSGGKKAGSKTGGQTRTEKSSSGATVDPEIEASAISKYIFHLFSSISISPRESADSYLIVLTPARQALLPMNTSSDSFRVFTSSSGPLISITIIDVIVRSSSIHLTCSESQTFAFECEVNQLDHCFFRRPRLDAFDLVNLSFTVFESGSSMLSSEGFVLKLLITSTITPMDRTS